MRKDVKAGLAISIVVIVASVWYFWGGSPNEPIALDSGASPAPAVTLTARPQPTPVTRNNNRNANRETAQRTGPESTRQNRQATRDRGAPRIANRTIDQPGDQPVAQTPPSTPMPEVLASAGEAVTTSDPVNSTSPGPQPAGEPVGPTLDRDTPTEAAPVASIQPPASPASTSDADVVSPSRPRPIDLAQSAPSSSTAAPKPGEGDAAVETYQVRKGDTLSQIAVIFYGSERYVEFLMQSNPQVASASSIVEGMVLRIPALPENFTQQASATSAKPVETAVEPAPASGATYTVKDGDSFYAIALRTLGAGSRWPEIYELNKSVVGKDPGKLRPGTVLKLPAKDATKGDQARSE